eukprot:2056019-Rhodomonas_salina.1
MGSAKATARARTRTDSSGSTRLLRNQASRSCFRPVKCAPRWPRTLSRAPPQSPTALSFACAPLARFCGPR